MAQSTPHKKSHPQKNFSGLYEERNCLMVREKKTHSGPAPFFSPLAYQTSTTKHKQIFPIQNRGGTFPGTMFIPQGLVPLVPELG